MTRKANKGMWLRQTEREQKVNYSWIILMVSAMIASTVLILFSTELTGFRMVYSPLAMLLVSGCLCVCFGILVRLQRQQWFYSGVLMVALGLVVLFGRQLLDGICLFWNQMGDTWTAGTGWVLPELEVRTQMQELSLLVFSVFAGIVCAVICCGLSACRLPALPVLLPGLLLAGMMAFRKDLSVRYVLPVLLASVFLLAVTISKENKQQTSAAIGRLLSVTVACVLALAITLIPTVRNWAAHISTELQEQVHIYRYETEYTTLPEGNFSDYQEDSNAKHPALVVNMDIPEELYLRGFTGAVFDGDCWTALDTTVLAENEELLYWLNLMEFNPNAQYEHAIFQSDITKNTITVQNIGACSRYLYVPFNLCAGSGLQAENLNTDGMTSAGDRIYVFSTTSGSAEMIKQTLEYLQTSDDEAVLNYRTAESAYRNFVYSNYLQIPQETAAALQQYWDDVAGRYGNIENLSHEQAQKCALVFLEECFQKEEKQISVKLPLENAAGSSYQYATVAALTLRYFGIPSRYAEGYIITEEMAIAENGNGIEADSSCAGGWVEVYQDGIGWIPMNRLPGFDESTQKPDDSHGSGQKDPGKLNPEEGEELEEEPDSKTEEPEPDGGYMVSLPKAILWSVLLIIALLLLLVFAFVIRHRLYLKRKQKRFDAENRKDAVAWIFADAAMLLETMGHCRGNGSMQGLVEPIRQRFGDAYAREYEAMVALNHQALFSSREMENENRDTAMAFHTATLQNLKSSAKWYQRMWMQWVLCLY